MEIDYLAHYGESIPQIADWFYEEWSYLYPDRSREDFETLIRQRANIGKLPMMLVAIESGIVIGTICLKMHDMETRLELTPWLAGLYVERQWRSKGIGTMLVEAIEKAAVEMGIRRIFLYTPKSEKFYEKIGWEVSERVRYRGNPVTLMEKGIIPRRGAGT